MEKQLSGNVLFLTQPVRVNYLFRLCALRCHGRKCPMCPDNIQNHAGLSLSPRQPADSCWEACRDKALIVTKWFHVERNDWFRYYKTFHLDVGQKIFFFIIIITAFCACVSSDVGHRISFILSSLCFRHLCLRTMNSPHILQQFTWAVSTPALESSHANAMAKAEKVLD